MRIFRLSGILFLCLLLSSCAGAGRAPALPQGAFRAELCGTQGELSFSALYERSAPIGDQKTPAVTLTFYAPQSLCGTVLHRDGAGAVTLSTGGVTHPTAAKGLLDLLDLFPTEGEIGSVTLTESKNSLVKGEDFSLELLPDGTPIALERHGVSAKIVFFEELPAA